jgi:hypothetical protein
MSALSSSQQPFPLPWCSVGFTDLSTLASSLLCTSGKGWYGSPLMGCPVFNLQHQLHEGKIHQASLFACFLLRLIASFLGHSSWRDILRDVHHANKTFGLGFLPPICHHITDTQILDLRYYADSHHLQSCGLMVMALYMPAYGKVLGFHTGRHLHRL